MPFQRTTFWHPALVAAQLTHLDGSMESASTEALPALLDELDGADHEHPDVAVTHESGWALSVFSDRRVVWENVEADDEPRHLDHLDRNVILSLLRTLVGGDLDAIQARAWEPGY